MLIMFCGGHEGKSKTVVRWGRKYGSEMGMRFKSKFVGLSSPRIPDSLILTQTVTLEQTYTRRMGINERSRVFFEKNLEHTSSAEHFRCYEGTAKK